MNEVPGKGRPWVHRLRPAGVAALAILLAVGGWIFLSRTFRSGTTPAAVTNDGPSAPVVVPPSETTTAPSPTEQIGTLAFESAGSSLFVLGLGDGRATKIVDRAGEAGLAWSPDASMIAFAVGISEGSGQIVVTDPAGSTVTVVTQMLSSGPPEPCCPQYPTWSPEGDVLAFTTGLGAVFTVGIDGSNLTQITGQSGDCSDFPVAWSPAGPLIVSDRHCSGEAESGIYAFGPTGSDPTLIAPARGDVLGLSVSTDGGAVAFAPKRKGVFVVAVDGSGLRQVTDGWDSSPTWSPDGKTIAFVRDNQVWTVPAAGGEAVQVTHFASIKVVALAWAPSS